MSQATLSLSAAHRAGTTMAAEGWTEAQVLNWCHECGMRNQGIAEARILRAYREQVNRG